MALLLARIDDRLVHGQVVLGCCERLRAQRLLLCDDAVASDSVLQSLFALATPPHIELEVIGFEAAIARLRALEQSGAAAVTILLVARCEQMLRLVEAGAGIVEVNLGGVHARDGAVELWPGFFLDAADRRALSAMLVRGVSVQVQTVPGAACVDAAILLGHGAS